MLLTVWCRFFTAFTRTQDYQQAVEWFTKAAEQGEARAQFNLGVEYYNGDGVPQDYQQAVEWFTKAAELGHAH